MLKQLVGNLLPLAAQARLVARFLPPERWYGAASRVSEMQASLRRLGGGNPELTRALMLDHWLRELTFSGAFPIPIHEQGVELGLDPGPKLYTGTHLPLTEIPLRALIEIIREPIAVVADPGKIVDGDRFLVFGWPRRIPAIPVRGDLMRNVLTTLKQGTSVVFLSDPYLGGALSDVPMRLARRAGVPVVFSWAWVGENRKVECRMRYAPQRWCDSDAAVEENLEFLREHNRKRLDELGWKPS